MATTPPDLAPMKAQVYKDPRPKEYFDRFHERSRTRDPDWVYEVVRVITSIYAWTFFRARGSHAEKVPSTGAVILAPNHFSFMDHFFAGAFVRRRVRFMAKSQLFERPMQWIYTHGGVFPVRRGYQDEDAFLTANGILARGGAIVMYCEGGRSRTGTLSEQPKRGHRAARAGVRRAGRADGDPRLLARAQLEAGPVPEGAGALRGRDPLAPGHGTDARPAAGRRERDLRAHQEALRRAGRLRKRAISAIAAAVSCMTCHHVIRSTV